MASRSGRSRSQKGAAQSNAPPRPFTQSTNTVGRPKARAVTATPKHDASTTKASVAAPSARKAGSKDTQRNSAQPSSEDGNALAPKVSNARASAKLNNRTSRAVTVDSIAELEADYLPSKDKVRQELVVAIPSPSIADSHSSRIPRAGGASSSRQQLQDVAQHSVERVPLSLLDREMLSEYHRARPLQELIFNQADDTMDNSAEDEELARAKRERTQSFAQTSREAVVGGSFEEIFSLSPSPEAAKMALNSTDSESLSDEFGFFAAAKRIRLRQIQQTSESNIAKPGETTSANSTGDVPVNASEAFDPKTIVREILGSSDSDHDTAVNDAQRDRGGTPSSSSADTDDFLPPPTKLTSASSNKRRQTQSSQMKLPTRKSSRAKTKTKESQRDSEQPPKQISIPISPPLTGERREDNNEAPFFRSRRSLASPTQKVYSRKSLPPQQSRLERKSVSPTKAVLTSSSPKKASNRQPLSAVKPRQSLGQTLVPNRRKNTPGKKSDMSRRRQRGSSDKENEPPSEGSGLVNEA